MTTKKMVADVSSCFTGSVGENLRRAAALANQQLMTESDITVIVHSDQHEVVFPSGFQEIRCPKWGAAPAVDAAVKALVEAGATDVTVVSYDYLVLRQTRERLVAPGINVRALHFGELRGQGDQKPPWRFASHIPESDALNVLVRALNDAKSFDVRSGMRSTSLRPAMSAIDARFRGGAQSTNTVGLVSLLIRLAELQGIVAVDRSMNVNPIVWLKNPVVAVSAAPAGAVSSASVTAEKLSAPSSVNDAASTPESDAKFQHRSRRLEQLLHSAGMGPYTIGRLAMMDAIKKVFVKGVVFSQLMSAAEAEAKVSITEKSSVLANQPWRKINELLTKLLTMSQSVLDNQNAPLPLGWGSRLLKVETIADDWSVRVDAELILALLHQAEDIAEDDATDLAGLLYHKRDDTGREKVFAAVSYLLSTGKVVEESSGSRSYLFVKDGARTCRQPNPGHPMLALAK